MTPSNDPGWELARAYLVSLQARLGDPRRTRDDGIDPSLDPEIQAHLRKVYLAEHPDGDEAGFQKLLEAYRAQTAAARAACPSPFENPDWYGLVTHLFERIARSAETMKMQLAHPPLLGTLATGRVNGVAIALEGSATRIILLEQGLFGFANLMCKAVGASLVYTGTEEGQLRFSLDPGAIRDKLAKDDAPIERFFDALTAYVVQGEPHRARPYAPPPYAATVASNLRESMETFILGHEYAHVALGHLDGKHMLHAVAAGVDAETVETNYDQEFQADLIGMMLTLQTLTREDNLDVALSYWGAHAFFGCIDIVERTVSLLATGEPATWRGDSHPPTRQRQQMLQLGLQSLVKPEEAAKGAIKLAEQIDEILAIYWVRCEGPLRRLHRDGVRPTAEWMAHTDSRH